jgi:uncharacterized protein (TIGR04255 family)
MKLPTKLKRDGIQEAVLEIRFRSNLVPEVFTGQLAGKLGAAERLPIADIPFPIRRSDPNLAYQAILQVRSGDNKRLAKIGEQVFSWHVLSPYPGWQPFKREIEAKWALLRETVPDISIARLGFRYVNLLATEAHGIKAVNDLNLHIEVAGENLSGPRNLNYKMSTEEQELLVRIATPEFVQGPDPKSFSVLVDLDVFSERTPPELDRVVDWTETAHLFLKQEFFKLLRPETVRELWES